MTDVHDREQPQEGKGVASAGRGRLADAQQQCTGCYKLSMNDQGLKLVKYGK